MKKYMSIAMVIIFAMCNLGVVSADTISGKWWTDWTKGYEIKDCVEFDIEVKGGDNLNNNLITVFTNKQTMGVNEPREEVGAEYKEYAVVRMDCHGWGGGDNCSIDGKDIIYYTDLIDYDEDGSTEDELIEILKDAHIDGTIIKTDIGVQFIYKVKGANGYGYTYKVSVEADTDEGLYVFFACDNSTVTIKGPDSEDEEKVDIFEEDVPLAGGNEEKTSETENEMITEEKSETTSNVYEDLTTENKQPEFESEVEYKSESETTEMYRGEETTTVDEETTVNKEELTGIGEQTNIQETTTEKDDDVIIYYPTVNVFEENPPIAQEQAGYMVSQDKRGVNTYSIIGVLTIVAMFVLVVIVAHKEKVK